MKIVADENIPYVNQLFGPLGEVTTLSGRSINARDVVDADVLLVRSVTPVNEDLLRNSPIKFVGTCTIGVDHLDVDYLNAHKISFASAPGCNANAVVQYVVSAITQHNRSPVTSPKVVIVGGGNVGSRVYAALNSLGFNCLCVDPFLDPTKANMNLSSWDAIYQADIVCCHTPLTTLGDFPTYHMIGEQELKKLRPGTMLLNAGRGAVIDNLALLKLLNGGLDIEVVLDVWEDEPNINIELLEKVSLGTPHIAGYSFEGRLTGSLMIFDALCEFLKRDETRLRQDVVSEAIGVSEKLESLILEEAIGNVYSVHRDYESLKSVIDTLPGSFDQLRKHYPQRREYSHFVLPQNVEKKEQLRALGFQFEKENIE